MNVRAETSAEPKLLRGFDDGAAPFGETASAREDRLQPREGTDHQAQAVQCNTDIPGSSSDWGFAPARRGVPLVARVGAPVERGETVTRVAGPVYESS